MLVELLVGFEPREEGFSMLCANFFRSLRMLVAGAFPGSLDGKRIIVQGLGNVGYHAANF